MLQHGSLASLAGKYFNNASDCPSEGRKEGNAMPATASEVRSMYIELTSWGLYLRWMMSASSCATCCTIH